MSQPAPLLRRRIGHAAPARWDFLRPPPLGQSLIYPRFRQLPPPLIVIGMHRSGTSLVAAMLGALGVFMGPECGLAAGDPPAMPDAQLLLNGYGEAVDFRRVNDRILARAGADWCRVQSFLERRDEPEFARVSAAALGWATYGPLRRYLGSLPRAFHGPWGWKDPRNSLTLPYWLRLFPQARVLHVRREPEAVVESLHRRARAWERSPGPPLPLGQRVGRWLSHPGTTLRRAGRRIGFLPPVEPDPCRDRTYCERLCRQYVQECLRFGACGAGYQEVWYEAILADPLAAAGDLAQFAGGSSSHACRRRAAALVRRGAGR